MKIRSDFVSNSSSSSFIVCGKNDKTISDYIDNIYKKCRSGWDSRYEIISNIQNKVLLFVGKLIFFTERIRKLTGNSEDDNNYHSTLNYYNRIVKRYEHCTNPENANYYKNIIDSFIKITHKEIIYKERNYVESIVASHQFVEELLKLKDDEFKSKFINFVRGMSSDCTESGYNVSYQITQNTIEVSQRMLEVFNGSYECDKLDIYKEKLKNDSLIFKLDFTMDGDGCEFSKIRWDNGGLYLPNALNQEGLEVIDVEFL